MPRIRCHYTDCVFVDDGYCGAAAVELDPDTGCATYAPMRKPLLKAKIGRKRNLKNGRKRNWTKRKMITGKKTKTKSNQTN